MEAGYIAALCGLAGAIIGSASTAIVTYITQRQETRRKLLSALVSAGLEQWKQYFGTYKAGHSGSSLYTPEVYIFALVQFASLIEKNRTLSDAQLIQEIRAYFAKINLVTHEYEAANAARQAASGVHGGDNATADKG